MTSSETSEPLANQLSSCRYPSRWRYLLLGVPIFALTIALFYREENWRGKRAWESCKHELEAEGAILDWSTNSSPPVPDDQNVLKVPQMQQWFLSKGSNGLMDRLEKAEAPVRSRSTSQIVIAELIIVPAGKNPTNREFPAILPFGDPPEQKQAVASIESDVGPLVSGAKGFRFTATRLDQVKPTRVWLQSERNLSRDDVLALVSNLASVLTLQPAGSNALFMNLNGAVAAADYLAWTAEVESDFATIREALKRPYARMNDDDQQPFDRPLPNFVAIRAVVQTLAQRAQCFLLLGQPERALGELTTIHQMRRLLENPPTGKPMTLIAAMMDVAIHGLYVSAVKDGMRLQAWREPQLEVLQGQFKETDLLPLVAHALGAGELAELCRKVEVIPLAELPNLWSIRGGPLAKNPWLSIYDSLPRGWIHQNLALYAKLMQQQINGLDLANGVIVPRKMDEATQMVASALSRFSPYTFIARIAVPNFAKASQTLSRIQTMSNQAQIVCALERYHIAHGEYPETLEVLIPQFIAKIPRDIIGGKMPHYHRTADGKFLLYSIGWSEKDHGGKTTSDGNQGDRVWDLN